MQILKLECLLAFFFILPFCSFTQDRIYFSKASRKCKVIAITASHITYMLPNVQADPVRINTPLAILVFNGRGDFLVPSKMDFGKEETSLKIKEFLSGDKVVPRMKDEIYTIAKTRMEEDIAKQDNGFIYISGQDLSKIDKRKIAVIIYKSGMHDVYRTVPIDVAADILWLNNMGSVPSNPDKIADNTGRKAESIRDSLAQLPLGSTPVNKISAVGGDGTSANESTTNSLTVTFEDLTRSVTQKEFEEKAIQKTRDLNSYLKILCTKSYGYEEHNKALDQAIDLFINEDAVVAVSSVARDDIKSYKIRQYLLRLKSLNYDRVEVEWTNVQYVDKLKKGVDGNYYGTVTFEQVFRGFIDGKIAYEDFTKKSATVVLKAYEKNKEGNTTEMWDVLLSDIGVMYTKTKG